MPLITRTFDSLPCTFTTEYPVTKLATSSHARSIRYLRTSDGSFESCHSYCRSADNLEDIDTQPDQASLAAVKALLDADISSAGIDPSQLHPALVHAVAYNPTFFAAMKEEHLRLQGDATSKLAAVDLSRYEDIEAPPDTSPHSDEDKPEILARWTDALRKAYTSSEYVAARSTELGLLEKFGKNAWLVGNSQLEDILKSIEAELAQLRDEHSSVVETRRRQQESVLGEVQTLEHTWKQGVGRVLETQVAAEGLKQQILEQRRTEAA